MKRPEPAQDAALDILETPRGANDGAEQPGSPSTWAKPSAYQVPTNYAYDPDVGYVGLTLHEISPRLADLAYPWLACQATEVVLIIILAVAVVVSSLPIISASFSISLVGVSYAILLPALQRLALTDLRLLKLLARQFEFW